MSMAVFSIATEFDKEMKYAPPPPLPSPKAWFEACDRMRARGTWEKTKEYSRRKKGPEFIPKRWIEWLSWSQKERNGTALWRASASVKFCVSFRIES
jgi:hypothetical protein